MLKKTAIAVAVLIVAVLAFAATKPDSFRIQRTASHANSPTMNTLSSAIITAPSKGV